MSKESVYRETIERVKDLLDEHIKDLDLVFPPVPIMEAKDLINEALKTDTDIIVTRKDELNKLLQ